MKFIVISGADACGKDTQIERLGNHFQKIGLKTQILTFRSSFEDFDAITQPETLAILFENCLMHFEPIARTLFLQSLIKNALDKIKVDTEIVIFNGYWYKCAAAEAAYGVPYSFWSGSAAQYFPRPDIAIHLDVPFEICLQRRPTWTPYEKGQARYWGVPSLNFENYQNSMRQHFQSLFASISEMVYRIDGSHPEDQVALNILSLFDESPMPKSTELFL
jgi:thymidylate kinase